MEDLREKEGQRKATDEEPDHDMSSKAAYSIDAGRWMQLSL
jgi:hypothetical protein